MSGQRIELKHLDFCLVQATRAGLCTAPRSTMGRQWASQASTSLTCPCRRGSRWWPPSIMRDPIALVSCLHWGHCNFMEPWNCLTQLHGGLKGFHVQEGPHMIQWGCSADAPRPISQPAGENDDVVGTGSDDMVVLQDPAGFWSGNPRPCGILLPSGHYLHWLMRVGNVYFSCSWPLISALPFTTVL